MKTIRNIWTVVLVTLLAVTASAEAGAEKETAKGAKRERLAQTQTVSLPTRTTNNDPALGTVSESNENANSLNQSSVRQPGEEINWLVISAGGGSGSSPNAAVGLTIGQTVVGSGGSTNYLINLGFWQDHSPASCCVGDVGNVDCVGGVDISDLSYLIDHLFISNDPTCCEEEANADRTGGLDISDLSYLIDHLFISNDPLGPC